MKLVSLIALTTILIGIITFISVTHHNQEVTRRETERRLQKEAQQKSEEFTKLEEQKKIAAATPKDEVSSGAPTDSTHRAARPSAASKPGDLIGNNTVKSAKTYYGGPLIFNPSTVTVSSSNPRPSITVTSYDGMAISMPSSYWDSNPPVQVGIDSNLNLNTDVERASWPMVVTTNIGISPGSYDAEIVAHTHNDVDTVEYSGHLTVIVVP